MDGHFEVGTALRHQDMASNIIGCPLRRRRPDNMEMEWVSRINAILPSSPRYSKPLNEVGAQEQITWITASMMTKSTQKESTKLCLRCIIRAFADFVLPSCRNFTESKLREDIHRFQVVLNQEVEIKIGMESVPLVTNFSRFSQAGAQIGFPTVSIVPNTGERSGTLRTGRDAWKCSKERSSPSKIRMGKTFTKHRRGKGLRLNPPTSERHESICILLFDHKLDKGPHNGHECPQPNKRERKDHID